MFFSEKEENYVPLCRRFNRIFLLRMKKIAAVAASAVAAAHFHT